jgi:menaquinone-dependent protoporphyrinogen IX oxidase
MSKIVVVYKSTYGFTEKYANWIADELGADLIERSFAKLSTLDKYSIIVYGAAIYASSFAGVDLVAKHPFKHLIVFTAGLTNPKTMDYVGIMKKAFPNSDIQPEKTFHLRGGLNFKRLGFMHRNLMKLLNNAVAKKTDAEMNEIEKTIKMVYDKQVDYTDRTAITPLVEYVLGLQKGEAS